MEAGRKCEDFKGVRAAPHYFMKKCNHIYVPVKVRPLYKKVFSLAARHWTELDFLIERCCVCGKVRDAKDNTSGLRNS